MQYNMNMFQTPFESNHGTIGSYMEPRVRDITGKFDFDDYQFKARQHEVISRNIFEEQQ